MDFVSMDQGRERQLQIILGYSQLEEISSWQEEEKLSRKEAADLLPALKSFNWNKSIQHQAHNKLYL